MCHFIAHVSRTVFSLFNHERVTDTSAVHQSESSNSCPGKNRTEHRHQIGPFLAEYPRHYQHQHRNHGDDGMHLGRRGRRQRPLISHHSRTRTKAGVDEQPRDGLSPTARAITPRTRKRSDQDKYDY